MWIIRNDILLKALFLLIICGERVSMHNSELGSLSNTVIRLTWALRADAVLSQNLCRPNHDLFDIGSRTS